MAAPAQTYITELANPFGGDHAAGPGSCQDDPNFATICSFIQKFGDIIKIGQLPFDELQTWLENTTDVPLPLVQLHLTLLRRVFKTVSHDKWERSLAKFGHSYCSQDAWEIERFGYKKAKIQTKLRLLKNLLEAQFDYNVKFKAEVNKLEAADLRLTPLGRDTEGQVYWYQVDVDANLRVYREDIDDETWEIVASSKDELVELISQLQRGEVRKPEPEAIILPEEDSNSKDAIEPKDIILDTGKVEDDISEDSTDNEVKQEKKVVEPFIIKHDFSGHKIQFKSEQQSETVIEMEQNEQNGDSEKSEKAPVKLVVGTKSKPKEEIVESVTEAPKTEEIISEQFQEVVQDVSDSEPSKNKPPTIQIENVVPKPMEIDAPSLQASQPVARVKSVPPVLKSATPVKPMAVAPVSEPVALVSEPVALVSEPVAISEPMSLVSQPVPSVEPVSVAPAPELIPQVQEAAKPTISSIPTEKKGGIDKIIRSLHASRAESMKKSDKKPEKVVTVERSFANPLKELEKHVKRSTKGETTSENMTLIKQNLPVPTEAPNLPLNLPSLESPPKFSATKVAATSSVEKKEQTIDSRKTASKLKQELRDKDDRKAPLAPRVVAPEPRALSEAVKPKSFSKEKSTVADIPKSANVVAPEADFSLEKGTVPLKDKEKGIPASCTSETVSKLEENLSPPDESISAFEPKRTVEPSSTIPFPEAPSNISVTETKPLEIISSQSKSPESTPETSKPSSLPPVLSKEKTHPEHGALRIVEPKAIEIEPHPITPSKDLSETNSNKNEPTNQESTLIATTAVVSDQQIKKSEAEEPVTVMPDFDKAESVKVEDVKISKPHTPASEIVLKEDKKPDEPPPVEPLKILDLARPTPVINTEIPSIIPIISTEVAPTEQVPALAQPAVEPMDIEAEIVTPEEPVPQEGKPISSTSLNIGKDAPPPSISKQSPLEVQEELTLSQNTESDVSTSKDVISPANATKDVRGKYSTEEITPTSNSDVETKVPETKRDEVDSIQSVSKPVEPLTIVVEEPITKTETWVCGDKKEEAKEVIEEEIAKTETWVCVDKKEDVKEVIEEEITKTEAYICGATEPLSVETPKVSETIAKEETATAAPTEHIKEEPGESVKKDTEEVKAKVDKTGEIVKEETSKEGPVKMQSRLISALYSDSSGESNDGFEIASDSTKIATNDDASIPVLLIQEKSKTLQSSNSSEVLPKSQTLDNSEHGINETTDKNDLKKDGGIVAESCEGGVKTDLNPVEFSEKAKDQTTDAIPKQTEKEVELNQVELVNPSETKPTIPESTAMELNESISGVKRKAGDDLESSSKVPKLDGILQPDPEKAPQSPTNPIVGETIEEAVMIVSGEGSGAANEGGNQTSTFNPIVGEEIEEEVMFIFGDGSGALNEGSNENSPVTLAPEDVPGSQDDSMESEESSRDAFPSRGRGGRRGRRGRRGRPAGVGSGGGERRSSQTSSTSRSAPRGLREVARLGISVDSIEVNGENERPVRASRRIAQIRLKEEEERRKLEEERLAQLKAAQMQKKAKQAEKDKIKGSNNQVKSKKGSGAGKKSQKILLQNAAEYLPSASESDDNYEEDDDGSDDEFGDKLGKKGKKKHRRGKNGKPLKKGGNPWATSSDEDEEEAVEEEEEYHYEEEEEELVFKSDHEFSPESDLGEEDSAEQTRHARTAKQDKGELFEEGNCCKCGKGDHPEWILLCDKCDKGWHASCLRPQLWVIPEGEWFCPPCQHNMLIENLSKNLIEYESLLKKRENEILRKQRLAYVGISLDNVLPDKPEEPPVTEPFEEERPNKEKKKQRRRILSDEEDENSDNFINDRSEDDFSSRSRSHSSDESDDEPGYRRRLRARRSKKAFNFKEYDDMINSALRVDDDEEGEYYPEKAEGESDGEDAEEEDVEQKLNGEEKETPSVGGGKNDAYIKHLERQALEEEETDEELLDEKERLRRRELKKSSGGGRKTRRRINDLDAYSEEEDSDDDFKASDVDDDDEEVGEDGESEWSGDKMEEDSDDSIARRARRKDRHTGGRRLGRREKYSDKGLVRRSTRKRKSRISYDESDEDEDEEEDQNDKWQSNESEEESEPTSESDDSTWGKKKKKASSSGGKSKIPNFMLGASSASTKGKGKGGVKRKKRKTDEDDVDRAWNSARGRRDKDEPIERRTRGRKINFKDILDSGESDDEGNVRPKRRPLSDSDDSRSPSSSRKLAEEIRAENLRKEKEYEAKKAAAAASDSNTSEINTTEAAPLNKDELHVIAPETAKIVASAVTVVHSSAPILSESLSIAKLAESSCTPSPKIAPSPVMSGPPSASPPMGSPHSLPPPPVVSSPLHLPPSSSPITMSPNPALVGGPLPPSSLAPLMTLNSNPIGIPIPPTSMPSGPPPPMVMGPGGAPSSKVPPPPPLVMPKGHHHTLPFPMGVGPLNLPPGVSAKPGASPPSMPLVPAPAPTDKKSKQSKRGSRGSKSEKTPPQPTPSPNPISPAELELASKSKQQSIPLVPSSPTKSSKKRDPTAAAAAAAAAAAVAASLSVPNPALLMASGVGLPEMLGQGMGGILRGGLQGPPTTTSSSGSSSKKGSKSSNSSRVPNATQQTTPPPVSQGLSSSIPIDIDRVPNPALFQGNPGMRPFHPMWVRNPGPPPQGFSPSGTPVPQSLGKPPPLNSSPFSGQQGPPTRPGYPSPPPLRIPNPNTSPLQAFQHFKRDGPLGGPLYRLPPGQPQPGMPLPNILPPGIMSPHGAGPERFFGAPAGYPHPYGILPPHTQGHSPQSLFPYDYRAPEPPFKEEPGPPRTSSSSMPTPVSSSSSSPPPATSAAVPSSAKEEGSSARDSEFGGLVSYFSSQRSEEDMDT